MDKKVGLLIIGILVLFSLNFVSSYTINTPIEIRVSCLNVNCSEQVNISIEFPNSSLAVNNQLMSNNSGYKNYTFSNTVTFGRYTYYTNNGFSDSFFIGEEMTTSKGLGYLGFILIVLFTFGLTLYGSGKIQWKHRRGDDGKIISINNFRYLKVFLYVMAYFELMFLFGLSYKFFNEANILGFTEFFNFVYQWFLNLIFPLIIVLIIIVFAIWITNKKLAKNLRLGIK